MNNLLNKRGANAPFWLIASLLIAPSLHGANTWDGGGNNSNWGNRNNWNGNTSPSNDGSADLIFSGSMRPSNTMDAAWNINSLNFSSTLVNFTITGNNALTIRNGITNNTTGTQTLNVSTILSGSQTWTSNSGSLVIGGLAGNRTLTNNGHTLTLDGSGSVLFNSQLNGSGGLIKNGSGTATLSYGNANDATLSSYTGTTTVNGGTLIADLGADDSSPVTPLNGAITIGGGASAATFETRWFDQVGNSTAVNVLSNGTFRVNASIYTSSLNETIGHLTVSGGSTVQTTQGASTTASVVLGSNLTHDGLGSTSANITGNLSLGGAVRTFDIGNSSATTDLNVSAIISSGGINKTGAGTLLLSGNNTYTGTTSFTAGTTLINGNQSATTGAVSVSSGATLSGTGTIGGATTISGTHAPGAAANGVGNQTFTSGITYASGSVFSWDLTENSNSIGFDTVSGSGALGVHSNAIFRVVLGSVVDLDNLFWSADRSWNIFSGFTGGSFNNALLQVVNQSGSPIGSSHGHFSVSGSTLNWSTNPEPSSALAGLLIGTGLLRRKRAMA
jgi:autotransporter-associated beta strand protein